MFEPPQTFESLQMLELQYVPNKYSLNSELLLSDLSHCHWICVILLLLERNFFSYSCWQQQFSTTCILFASYSDSVKAELQVALEESALFLCKINSLS